MTLRSFFSAAFFSFLATSFSQDITVKGIVYDKDSTTPMQFAYVINKNSSTGMVADEKGSFTMRIHLSDTLTFSYVGYYVTKVFTHLLKDSVKNSVLNVKACLKPKARELNPVIITPHVFSKAQKELYAGKLNEYNKVTSSILASVASPISALYYAFSKRGKELQKLSFLYDQMLVDERKEARLSPEKIRSITGNDTLHVRDFLHYCFLPDQFVISASDYDLFLSVSKYYKQYMEEQRRKK